MKPSLEKTNNVNLVWLYRDADDWVERSQGLADCHQEIDFQTDFVLDLARYRGSLFVLDLARYRGSLFVLDLARYRGSLFVLDLAR